MPAELPIWTKHNLTVREVETALHNCYTKGYLIVGGFSCVEKRLSTEALGDDPHLNPPPSKGEEMALTLTINGETAHIGSVGTSALCSFPLLWGKVRMGVLWPM